MEVELDVFGMMSPGINAFNVDAPLFKSQTIGVSGTAKRTKFPVPPAANVNSIPTTSVLVFEATSNSAIELLKLKACKLERSLSYLLTQHAISAGVSSAADILDVVVFAGIATQVAVDDAVAQLGAFIDTNKGALPLVHTLALHGSLAFANIPVHGAEYVAQLHNEVEQLSENVDRLRVVVEQSDREREAQRQQTDEELKRIHDILRELQAQQRNVQPLMVTINSNASPISVVQSSSNTVPSIVTADPGSNAAPRNICTAQASSNIVIDSYSNFSISSDPASLLPIINVDGRPWTAGLGTDNGVASVVKPCAEA